MSLDYRGLRVKAGRAHGKHVITNTPHFMAGDVRSDVRLPNDSACVDCAFAEVHANTPRKTGRQTHAIPVKSRRNYVIDSQSRHIAGEGNSRMCQ
jgi:hypothetical protein